MDRLPQEIYNEIATCVVDAGTQDLASIATVSQRWQLAIERHTCRSLVITSDEINEFNHFFSKRHRRRFLRTLFFQVRLPTYDYMQRERYECERDRRVNDEAFTTAMQQLFRTLSSWDPAIDSSIKLRITELLSPSDNEPQGESDEMESDSDSDSDSDSFLNSDLGEQHHLYSYIQLLTSFDMSPVSVIDSLGITKFKRKVAHCVPLQLTALLPNLREAFLCVDDMEDRFPRLRGENRAAMTDWIQTVIPYATGLRDLSFSVYREEDSYGARLPNCMPDHLCRSIRESTAHLPHLKRLAMEGTIDKLLFWPDTSQTLVVPFWQHLELLEVTFYPSKSSNGWYFKGYRTSPQVLDDSPELIEASEDMPPGYGNDGEQPTEFDEDSNFHQFLSYAMPHCPESATPDENLIVPLLESFANACAQMPNLKQAHLVTSVIIKDNPGEMLGSWEADWGVWYIGPLQKLCKSSRGISSIIRGTSGDRRLIWDVGDWRPSEHLQSVFEGIGREKHGNQMSVAFIDSWNLVLKPQYIERARREAAEFLGANLVEDDYLQFVFEQDWDLEDTYLLDILQEEEEEEEDEEEEIYEIETALSWEIDIDEIMDDELDESVNDEIWEGLMGSGEYL